MRIFYTITLSIMIGCFSAYVISRLGIRFGFVDTPNIRSSHKQITPRGGGIGIPIALLLIVLFFIKDLYLIMFLSVILSVFSLIDDKMNLPVFLRFGIEVFFSIAVILLYKKNLLFKVKEDYGLILALGVIFILTILITAATNFFNFMDGIDGIAGFEAIISFGLLAYYISHYKNSEPLFIISLSVIASSIGFLIFNFPKARVFMGDVGSIFLGFLFASLVVIVAKDLKELLVLLSFQSVFYVDCISTIFIRAYRRENIFKAHLMHLYQRLVHKLGWSHPKVTIVYSITQVIIAIIGILLLNEKLIYLLIYLSCIFFFYFVIRIRGNLIE